MNSRAGSRRRKAPENGDFMEALTGGGEYMNMNSGSIMRHAFRIGLLLWLAGTILVRFSGHGLLRPTHTFATLILFAASFLLIALLIPRLCRRLGLEKELWFEATALLTLPTLALDPFSCLFFSRVFPNLDPSAAGAFGGWMMICCAGAFTGVWLARGRTVSPSAQR